MSNFKAKMHQIQFRLGLRPRPCWGSLHRFPDSIAGFKGPTSKGRAGEGKRRNGSRLHLFCGSMPMGQQCAVRNDCAIDELSTVSNRQNVRNVWQLIVICTQQHVESSTSRLGRHLQTDIYHQYCTWLFVLISALHSHVMLSHSESLTTDSMLIGTIITVVCMNRIMSSSSMIVCSHVLISELSALYSHVLLSRSESLTTDLCSKKLHCQNCSCEHLLSNTEL